VYIHSWQEFQDAAEALYTKSPDKVRSVTKCNKLVVKHVQARYCVKWKSSEGRLILKVTDNTSVSYNVCISSLNICDLSFQVHQVQNELVDLP
jgi:hypothetical protein